MNEDDYISDYDYIAIGNLIAEVKKIVNCTAIYDAGIGANFYATLEEARRRVGYASADEVHQIIFYEHLFDTDFVRVSDDGDILVTTDGIKFLLNYRRRAT